MRGCLWQHEGHTSCPSLQGKAERFNPVGQQTNNQCDKHSSVYSAGTKAVLIVLSVNSQHKPLSLDTGMLTPACTCTCPQKVPKASLLTLGGHKGHTLDTGMSTPACTCTCP